MFRTTILAVALTALVAPAASAMSMPILLPPVDFPAPDAPTVTRDLTPLGQPAK